MDEHLPDDVVGRERRQGNGFVPEYQRALAGRGWLEPWLATTDDGSSWIPCAPRSSGPRKPIGLARCSRSWDHTRW